MNKSKSSEGKKECSRCKREFEWRDVFENFSKNDKSYLAKRRLEQKILNKNSGKKPTLKKTNGKWLKENK